MKNILYLFAFIPLVCLGQTSGDCENISSAPPDLIICDNDFDGSGVFDLTSINSYILNGQDPSNYNISFHESQAGAENNTNPISSPYTNSTPDLQSIYTRTTDIDNTCLSISSFNIIVNPLPFLVLPTPLEVCDDGTPDGLTQLDLSIKDEEIRGGNSNYSISYYLTQLDADSGTSPLTIPYTNISNPQTIFVRGQDITTGCSTTTTLDLGVIQAAAANTPPAMKYCDPDNDGYGEFILTDSDVLITGGVSGVTVTYHETLSDAENGVNALASPYNNIVINTQTIYARVESATVVTDCATIVNLVLNVSPTPQLITPTALELCDDNLDQVVQFDLTTEETYILNGELGVSATYHETLEDAQAGENTIVDPETYTNTETPVQTIYVRVTNDLTGCYAITAFDLVVTDCTVSSPVCGDTIFDSGGDTGDYGNNELTNVTVYPETTGDLVTFNFISFNTEANYDNLTVYDGPDTLSTIVGVFDGTEIPDPISSTHATGALTFVFDSDGSVVRSGYEIVISCAAPTVGIIQVNAFVDANINNVYDNDEFSFSSGYFIYELNGDGIINNISSSTGNFQIISENETDFYNISFNLHDEYVDCYDITQVSFDNISVATGSTISIEFPVVEEQICEDLAVYLINYFTPPRPGFSHYNYLVLENLGFTSISSGTVEFTHDPLLIYNSVTSVNPNYTIINTATGFTVDFLNLQPGNVEYIEVSLTSPTNLELGDITTNTATYSTNSNDLVSSNNFSTLSELVVGSWDPNDKMESRGPSILYDDFVNSDNWLYYTVRFQNLGTFPATFVRIEDELDSQLDETSFQMLQSSHDYVVKRTVSSLEWFFDDINLPAEQDDSQGSNGFIYFRIKLNTGYAVGDVIPNTAEIYFDFNEPVITNRFETEFIQDTFSVSEFDNRGFNMYPNPTNDILNIKLNNINKANLSIWDIRGKLISQQTIFEEQNLDLNVLELQSGIYFVKINTPHTKIVKKLIIE